MTRAVSTSHTTRMLTQGAGCISHITARIFLFLVDLCLKLAIRDGIPNRALDRHGGTRASPLHSCLAAADMQAPRRPRTLDMGRRESRFWRRTSCCRQPHAGRLLHPWCSWCTRCATLPLERPAPPACCCWSFRLPAPDEPPVTCCSSSSWNFRRSSRFSFLSSSNFICLCSSSMQVRSPPLSLPQPSDTGHWTQCSVSVRGCVIRPLARCVAPSFLSVASCTGQALDGKAVTNLTRNHLSEVPAVVEVLW